MNFENRIKKILAIDDIDDNLNVLQVLIAEAFPGIKFLSARSGFEGLALCHREMPDVVLLTVAMPGMDGYEVCKTLRADQLLKSVPVILITADTTDRDSRKKGLECGADAFLTKPVDIYDLTAQIRAMLRIREGDDYKQYEKERLQEAESALLHRTKAFQNYFQNCSVGMSVTSPDKKWLEVNQSLCQMLGYEKEELVSMNWSDLTYPDDLEKNIDLISKMAVGKSDHFDLDKRFIRKDGTILYASLSAVCDRNPDGSLNHILASYIDVTARHLAEEANRQERSLLRTLIDNLPDSIYVKDAHCRKIIANKADLKHMGYISTSEIFGKTDMEIFPDADGTQGYLEDLQVIQTGLPLSNMESVFTGSDGKIHWRITSKYPFFDDNLKVQGLVGIGFDITDRKLTEEALKASEELYRNLVEKLPDGVYKSSQEGKFISVNPAMIKMLGYDSKEDLLGVDIKSELYCDPEDRHGSVSNESGNEFGVFKLKRKDFSEIWVEDHSWYNTDEKGNILFHEGIIRDVTDRKRDEDRLRSLSRAVEQNPVSIMITDTWGRIEYVNPKFSELTGYSSDEVIGRNPRLLKSGSTTPEEYSKIWKIICAGGEWKGEFKNIKKSGEEYYENALISPIKDEKGRITHFLAVKEDITERKHAEETITEINRKLAYAQQIAHIGNWEIYLPTGELHWSEEMNQVMSFTSVLPVNISEIVKIFPPEEYKRFSIAINAAIVNGAPYSMDYRIIGSDGIVRYIHDEGEIASDEHGSPTWMYGTTQDITERKQAELALQESNELNNSLLQSIPFGMDIVDEYGNVLFQSEILEKLYDHKAIGQKCWNLYRDNHSQCIDCPLYSDIEIGMTKISETANVFGGRIFQINHTGMLFQGKKAILEIFQDITEKKEVEKRVKLLAHSLEGISECVSITDTEDILIYVNESFVQTYGYTEQELIGKHISIVRSPDTANGQVSDILHETIEGGWRGEIMNRSKDGTVFPILLSTSVIKDENEIPIALIGVAIDVSEMKKNREELIAAKESAEESNRLKSAFLATMNHELRTPLNHILGFSELIMSGVATEDNISFASSIQTSGQSLLSIIEGVFDLALLEQSNIKLRKQTFSLMDNFMENKASFDNILRTSARHEQINLIFKPDSHWLSSYVTADRSKINQVLTNLFKNAVKFTQKGTIEFGYKIEHESSLMFYLKDTGIGIEKEKQSIIFDFFRQGDDSFTRVYGGIGIGLAISQKITQILKGELKVISEPGKGSTFSLTVPVELSRKNESKDM